MQLCSGGLLWVCSLTLPLTVVCSDEIYCLVGSSVWFVGQRVVLCCTGSVICSFFSFLCPMV